MTAITLPMIVFDEQRAINRVAIQVATVLHKMSADASRETLASLLRDCLRQGDLIVTVKAIEAAEKAGDELADSVLRFTYAEMKNAREPMSKQLEAFGVPHRMEQGRSGGLRHRDENCDFPTGGVRHWTPHYRKRRRQARGRRCADRHRAGAQFLRPRRKRD
jgi:hypothetical protein